MASSRTHPQRGLLSCATSDLTPSGPAVQWRAGLRSDRTKSSSVHPIIGDGQLGSGGAAEVAFQGRKVC